MGDALHPPCAAHREQRRAGAGRWPRCHHAVTTPPHSGDAITHARHSHAADARGALTKDRAMATTRFARLARGFRGTVMSPLGGRSAGNVAVAAFASVASASYSLLLAWGPAGELEVRVSGSALHRSPRRSEGSRAPHPRAAGSRQGRRGLDTGVHDRSSFAFSCAFPDVQACGPHRGEDPGHRPSGLGIPAEGRPSPDRSHLTRPRPGGAADRRQFGAAGQVALPSWAGKPPALLRQWLFCCKMD